MDTETQACDQCYRTKQVCSKSLPRCQRCLNNSNPCTYSFGKFMGKPKRSNKIRRQSSSNEHDNVGNASGGKFFGLLNLKNEISETQMPSPVTDGTPSPGLWTPSSWDQIPEGVSSETSSTSNPASPNRVRTHSVVSGNRMMATPACDQCYRFKVKCSRDPNCCKRCANNRSVCTYSAASGKPESKVKAMEEHGKNKLIRSPQEDVASSFQDFSMTGVDSKSTSYTDSPTSQRAELYNDGMNEIYENFNVPAMDSYGFTNPPLEGPSIVTNNWTAKPSNFFGLDGIGLEKSSEQYPIHWQTSDILQNSVLPHHQLPSQKFQLDSPTLGQLQSPTSPEFARLPIRPICGCFQTALGVLDALHSCLNHQQNPEFLQQDYSTGSRDIFNATNNALEICERSTHCGSSHTSMTSMLYAVILQQVSTCYVLLSSHDMQTKTWGGILRNERMRGESACQDLERRLRGGFDEMGDHSEVMGRNSVLGLLAGLRIRFGEGH